MLEAKNGEELLRICEAENIPLSEYAIRIEMEKAEITREEAYSKMRDVLQVMKDGANEGRAKEVDLLVEMAIRCRNTWKTMKL